MIKVEFLKDLEGASKYGSCDSCGMSSRADNGMVRVKFYRNDIGREGVVAVCLCNECRQLLYRTI